MRTSYDRRPGTVIPLLAVTAVALLGVIALGVDLGLLALARSECQHAADAVSLATLRSLNGSPGNNATQAVANGKAVAAQETVLGYAVDPNTDLTIQLGCYVYDPVAGQFGYQIPRQDPTENLTLVQATVRHTVVPTFGRVLGAGPITVSATATTVHRPRDVTIVLDFSGSMNNESDMWNNEVYLGTENNSPNNLDTRVPRFSHYSATTFSPTGNSTELLITTSTAATVGRCNITQPALGVPAMVGNYYSDVNYTTPAFTSAGNGDATGWVSGDVPLRAGGQVTGSGAFVKTVADITGSTSTNATWESSGYDNYYGGRPAGQQQFLGYIQGPAYYGKTFFIWPPDPRAPVGQPDQATPAGTPTANVYIPGDWRRRFFFKSEDTASAANFSDGVNDNSRLWNLAKVGSGGGGKNQWDWRDATTAAGGYRINYKAILKWLKYDGPNPFPARLQAGRILFYDQIPDDVPAAAYDPTYASKNITDPNQRFWREYIDFVIGVWQSPYAAVQRPGNRRAATARTSPGPAAPTPRQRCRPSRAPSTWPTTTARCSPRHRFWFGPMTLIQYLSDTGHLPGTATDISMYALKLGVQLGLQDIQNNYPNTQVALIMFCRPRFNGEPQEAGRFTTAQVPMTGDYTALIYALWYPPGTSTGQLIRPWDTLAPNTPYANGDYNANTATYYGFMVAHNEFSQSATARSWGVGGHGRKGTDRLVIFETDGMANVAGPSATVFNSGESFYDTRSSIDANGNSVTAISPDGSSAYNRVQEVVQRLVAQETDTANGPGFARPNAPVIIHTLAFGAVFESNAAEKPNAVNLLQMISGLGGTTFPSSDTDPVNGYKWIIGDLNQRKDRMRQAVLKCMHSGVPTALVSNTPP
jgi:hypothetical protein